MMELEQLLPAYTPAALPDERQPELPAQPRNLRETGLEQQLVVELLAKLLLLEGRTHLPVLTARLRLSINVLRDVLAFMLAEQLAEVAWRGESDLDVQYQLTAAGKQRAAQYLERCPYVGPAPVTLEAYSAMLERQSWRRTQQRVDAGDVQAIFGADHRSPAMLAQLGAAMQAARALLLYGPSGSGKTYLASKLGLLLHGLIGVPHALLVGQEIIAIHDPLLHLAPAPHQLVHVRQLQERRSVDARWVLCQRPVVQVGTEFDAAMLDLRHDAYNGCYQAPPHLRANGGLFLVDDLGRQRIDAAHVLNRLLAPLDAGADQLTLRGGHPFTVPFDAVLVCATNLPPHSLLDAAALRRIGYKVAVGPLSEEAYVRLLRETCRDALVECDEAGVRHLLTGLHGRSGTPLLAAWPGELAGRVADFAAYAGDSARLTPAAVEQAWASMFTCAATAAEAV